MLIVININLKIIWVYHWSKEYRIWEYRTITVYWYTFLSSIPQRPTLDHIKIGHNWLALAWLYTWWEASSLCWKWQHFIHANQRISQKIACTWGKCHEGEKMWPFLDGTHISWVPGIPNPHWIDWLYFIFIMNMIPERRVDFSFVKT